MIFRSEPKILRSKVEIKTESGEKINFDFSFTPEDFWFTAKDHYVYVISLTTKINETISVKALFNYRQEIKNITVLGSNVNVKWQVSGDKVNITLPINIKTDEPGFVLKVELK